MVPAARPVALIASFVVHASITAGLAFRGTHPAPPSAPANELLTIAIEAEAPAPPAVADRAPEPTRAAHAAVATPPRTSKTLGAIDAPPPAPAAVTTMPPAARDDAALPRFTLALGTSTTGSSAARGVADHAEVTPERAPPALVPVLAASAAQVRAQLVAAFPAAYPLAARSDGLEAEVPLEVVLDETGRVVEARVVRAAGNGFDASALAAVRRYRFSPAERDGHAIRVRMPWTVQFRLN